MLGLGLGLPVFYLGCSMKFHIFLVLWPCFLSRTALGISLDESYFRKLDYNKLPLVKKAMVLNENLELKHNLFKEQFASSIILKSKYQEDKSRQLNRFVPVTSPLKFSNLSFSKGTRYGVSGSAGVFLEQFTNNFLRRSTTLGGEINLSIDLYKDLIGRTTRKKLVNSEDEKTISSFQKSINIHHVKIKLLKLYWNLVANEEAMRINKLLIEQAKKRVRITARKLDNSIADAGTLARVRSIYAGRKSSLDSLKYNKSSLLKSLREILPLSSDDEFILGQYDIERTIKELFICTELLEKYPQAPLKFSHIDEIASIRNQISRREEYIANVRKDIDIKLLMNAKVVGRDFSISEGSENLAESPQNIYGIELQLRAPLGNHLEKTSDSLKRISKYRREIAHNEASAKLTSYHVEMLKSIGILKNARKNQIENNTMLRESLRATQRKFSQARISIEQLVSEEDAYFSSELDNIQTNLNIIHTLYDYFLVFTNAKCSLNP